MPDAAGGKRQTGSLDEQAMGPRKQAFFSGRYEPSDENELMGWGLPYQLFGKITGYFFRTRCTSS